MPDEERAEAYQRPPALADGSMPTYGSHPLPVHGRGEPPWSPFGWGPDLEQYDVQRANGHPAGRILLLVALLIMCGAAVAGLITVLAVEV